MDKLLYGDFEEQYTDYETAEIAILPVPYDHVPYSKLRPTWNFTISKPIRKYINTVSPL